MEDDSRAVEQVHVGLVYSFIGDSPEISIKETEKMEGVLVGSDKIEKYIEGNPSAWTLIIYKEYISKI